MAGIQVPIGLDPVNPVPVDYRYGPHANLAAAKTAIPLGLRYQGLTVGIVGSDEYWWPANGADLSDAGLVVKGGGALLPTVRNVYLVNDASDQARMGGVTSNVYITAQAAFNAARTLAAGGVRAVILVGNTTAANVGDVIYTGASTLAQSISWVGLDHRLSNIGNVNTTGALGSSGNIFRAKDISFGTFANDSTGSPLQVILDGCIGGDFTFYGNFHTAQLGSLGSPNAGCKNSIVGNITIITPGSGSATLSISDSPNLRMGNITGTQMLTGACDLRIQQTGGKSNRVRIGNVTLNGGNTTQLQLSNVEVSGISITSSVNVAKNIVLELCDISNSVTINIQNNTNSLTILKSTILGTTTLTNSTITNLDIRNSIFRQVVDMVPNCVFQDCSFFLSTLATPVINGIGTGCEFYLCSIIGGSLAIDNGSAVSVKFTGGNSVAKSAMGSNITLT